jgi:hypothetical protein
MVYQYEDTCEWTVVTYQINVNGLEAQTWHQKLSNYKNKAHSENCTALSNDVAQQNLCSDFTWADNKSENP